MSMLGEWGGSVVGKVAVTGRCNDETGRGKVIPFSVVNMNWTDDYRSFIVETFVKNNESVTAT